MHATRICKKASQSACKIRTRGTCRSVNVIIRVIIEPLLTSSGGDIHIYVCVYVQ